MDPELKSLLLAIGDKLDAVDRKVDALAADVNGKLGALASELIDFKRAMSQNHFELQGRVKATDERLDNHLLHHPR